jgi:hypothetical protein
MPCCKHCECHETCEDKVDCCDNCAFWNGTECTLEEEESKFTGEEEE